MTEQQKAETERETQGAMNVPLVEDQDDEFN